MPLYGKTLAERLFLSWTIPKMIPKIAKGFPINTRANGPVGKDRNPRDGKPSGTDTSPKDKLAIANLRDWFTLESNGVETQCSSSPRPLRSGFEPGDSKLGFSRTPRLYPTIN